MSWTLPQFPNVPLADWLRNLNEDVDGDHPRFTREGPRWSIGQSAAGTPQGVVWVFVYEAPGAPGEFEYSVWIDGIPCDGEWDAVFVIETRDPDVAEAAYRKALDIVDVYGCEIPDALYLGYDGQLYDPAGRPRTATRELGELPLLPGKGRAPGRAPAHPPGLLDKVNRDRARRGQDALAEGEWSTEDLEEFARHVQNPAMEQLKRRLMR